MRVAFWHFYTFRLLRGIETLVISLSNALARKGVDVSIVTARPSLQPLTKPEASVKVYAYPVGRYFAHWSVVPFYACHFLRHEYDHVIAFFADFGEGQTWSLLSHFKAIPISLYLCYPPSSVPHRYDSFLRLSWHQHAKCIFADAGWVSKEAEQLFGRPIPVIPPGTDPERFRPNAVLRATMRQKYGFTDQDMVLLNVSALERRKGPRRVVEAVHRLRDRFPSLRYFVLGTGEDEPSLRRLVHDRGLGKQVIFGGRTTELEAHYNLADIFVMLPEAEANSVACHEAMSSGLPVMVSASGGFPESVPPQAGLFAHPDKAAEIDAALTRLMENPSLRRSMGEAGRAHILANCTWDKAADRFLELVA